MDKPRIFLGSSGKQAKLNSSGVNAHVPWDPLGKPAV
jgi:hypothetical protein